MRTRRIRIVNRLEALADELFTVMYDELHQEHDEFWREAALAENCAYYGNGCPDCKNPVHCKQFLFKKSHRFSKYNEILHV